MNNLIISFFVVLFLSTSVFSQNFIDEEIDALATKIASRIDGKNAYLSKRKKYKKIMVEPFTDTEGKISKLGANLAEEFSLSLANLANSFTISGNQYFEEELSVNKDIDLSEIGDSVKSLGHGIGKNSNENGYEIQRRAEGAGDILSGIEIGKQLLKGNENARYKGIDAVVKGTFTESNDQYRINIKVYKTGKGWDLIVGDKGYISKTPFIRALEAEQLERQRRVINNGGDPIGRVQRKGMPIKNFSMNYLEFKLIDCKQVGQTIECVFSIVNNGADTDMYIYGASNESRLINADGGFDYWATKVKFGEVQGNREAKKTLITGVPVEATITFGGLANKVRAISKLEVKCWDRTNQSYMVEMRDIRVR